jgi:hypothetical protein
MKGVPFSDARVTMRTLEWYRGAISKNLDDPDQAKWREATVAHLKDIDNEIAAREEVTRDAQRDHVAQDVDPFQDDMPF